MVWTCIDNVTKKIAQKLTFLVAKAETRKWNTPQNWKTYIRIALEEKDGKNRNFWKQTQNVEDQKTNGVLPGET